MNNKWQSRLAQLLKEENAIHNTTTSLREAPIETALRYVEDSTENLGMGQNLTAKTAKTPNGSLKKLEITQKPAAKTAKTLNGDLEKLETVQNSTAKTAKTTKQGLVATWSREFGYLAIHDPTSDEWFDLPTKDVPDWAKREARKRKELWRSGDKRAYELTATEMGEIWEKEQIEMWEHPAVTDKGIVYEDYLEEDE